MSNLLPGNEIIDTHAHILPGVDDGARDLEESLWLLRTAYENGIRTIYATPHYSRKRTPGYILEAYEALVKEKEKSCPDLHDLEIYLGHELTWHEGLLERLKAKEALTLNGTDKTLIEFLPGVSFQAMDQALRELLNGGYRPVIAHMERYECLKDPEHIYELRRAGCLVQMNFCSLTGDSVTGKEAPFGGLFSKEIRRCRNLVTENLIDLFGTDMHRKDLRPPEIKKSVDWLEKNGMIQKNQNRL